MRQRFLFFCAVLTTLGLAAFGVIHWNSSETNQTATMADRYVVLESQNLEEIDKDLYASIFYDFGPRFVPMTKTKLQKAKSIHDFYNAEEMRSIKTLTSVHIIVIKNERQTDIREIGYSAQLSKAQLELLRSFDYSSNFSIQTNFEGLNKETGKLEDRFYNPHLTIVPEKSAKYVLGKEAFVTYLKENSKKALANIQTKKLRPAKLYFTVKKNGTIENIRLDNPTGYPELDNTMIELISKVPGEWEPAENSQGEKVDQELVISIGVIGHGC